MPAGALGWTHGDVQYRNLLWEGGELAAVLDWDRVGVRPYTEEVARTAQVQFGVDGVFDLARVSAFVRGYRSVVPLEAEALADGVRRLWWKRMTDYWQLEFHYDRGDHSFDELFTADEALLHWWTDRYRQVEDAFTEGFEVGEARSHERGRVPTGPLPEQLVVGASEGIRPVSRSGTERHDDPAGSNRFRDAAPVRADGRRSVQGGLDDHAGKGVLDRGRGQQEAVGAVERAHVVDPWDVGDVGVRGEAISGVPPSFDQGEVLFGHVADELMQQVRALRGDRVDHQYRMAPGRRQDVPRGEERRVDHVETGAAEGLRASADELRDSQSVMRSAGQNAEARFRHRVQDAGDERGGPGLFGDVRRALLRGDHDVGPFLSQHPGQSGRDSVLRHGGACHTVPLVPQDVSRLLVRRRTGVEERAELGQLAALVPGCLVGAEAQGPPTGRGKLLGQELLGDFRSADEKRGRRAPPGEEDGGHRPFTPSTA